MEESSFWKNIGVTHYELLEKGDSLSVFENWKSAYCPNLNIKQQRGYAWESVEGIALLEDAMELYSQNSSVYYYVLSEPMQNFIEVAITKEKPFYASKYRYDYYVFPKNMAWCMSFTHEDGWLGPVFSKHRSYEKLQKKNVEAIEAIKRGYA
ncbi:hypothetical protein L1F30_09585 [Simiduia sp. 21SJ11W-1]|uniref:hypothetical protein n=1 Tax=Simiduia sp. 21SJ11W-1 TaxID=2909669 RepID=UPI0020A040FB|nr:hypothetical protein [Simiduia sp. 21SJ11W-1]UTA46425.1 hypothetical protein L1F30_09585 [Simiduia sp. 21SJ11W-1]